MDWLPCLQTLPFRAVGPLGQQLWQAALMGTLEGWPPGRPCDGASWTQHPHLCCRSSLGWALRLPGTFFPWGRDTAALRAAG